MGSDLASLGADAPDVVFSLDDQGRVSSVGAAVRTVLGYEPGELIGAPYERVIWPEDVGKAREAWRQAVGGEAVRGAEFRFRRRDGQDVAARCDVVPQFDAAGHFLGAHGVGRVRPPGVRLLGDPGSLLGQIAGLCERGASGGSSDRVAEVLEAIVRHPARLGVDLCWIGLLDEGSAVLRPVVHHGADGCLLVTEAARVLGADSPAGRAIGTRRVVLEDLAAGGPALGAMEEQARARGYRSLAAVPMVYGERALGVLVAYSRRPAFFDGWMVFLLELYAVAAASAAASARASESARQSEGRFQRLVEGLPCVVYVVQPTLPPTFLFISGNIERFVGYTSRDFYADGSLAFRTAHAEDRDRLIETVRGGTERPEPYTVEYRIVHRNGRETYYVVVRSTPVLDSEGRVVLRQGLIVDVTEQKRLERELLQSQRLAAIGEMAAMMAHEVRNPVAGMALALRMLRGLPPKSPVARECLDDLEAGLQRVNATVSRVLDFSKARPLQFRRCALGEIVGAAERLTATYIRRNNIALTVDLAPGLPELVADLPQLEQVFVNLMLNACKAMPEGGRLSVRARAEGGQLVAEVADTGIGISPERQKDIFNPFYSGFGDGTGLGLSLCQRIVTAHGGSLRVESTPGQGSTFRIELPLEPPDAPRAAR